MVLCPWHRFMVTIDEGVKAYQGVEIVNGKPVKSGWKLGKVVQRPYRIIEKNSQIYLVSILLSDFFFFSRLAPLLCSHLLFFIFFSS